MICYLIKTTDGSGNITQYPALYYLTRNPDGSIEPLVSAELLSDSPTELYEAVQTTDDMQGVVGWLDTGSNKSRLFLMVIMAVVTLFIMFMAMTYKKSGGSAALGIHSIILAWALPGVVLDGPPAADEIDPELKKKLKSILEQDPMSTAFTQQHISSAIEKFVDRGRESGGLVAALPLPRCQSHECLHPFVP